MRKKIIICAMAAALIFALIGTALYLYTESIPKELIEYKSSDKWGADGYTHMAAYMNTDAGFTANTMLRIKSEIEDAYKVDSIETSQALYSSSCEVSATLFKPDSDRTSSCTATLYLGDYFKFHPLELVEGSYPDTDSTMTDALLVDELAAWQLFGTQRGVVGLEVNIGNDIYVVCGVTALPDGVYNEVYGESPRVYINADSSYYRSSLSDRAFTSFEAMLPDPITNFAQNTLDKTLSSFEPVIKNIDIRFDGEALDEVRETQTALITDSNDTEYPYTEKAMIILSLKAADVYAVQKVMFYISLVCVAVLFFAIFKPVVKFIEKLFSKLKF